MDIRVQKVIDLMKSELNQDLTLDDMARYVRLSPSRLRHLFETETGRSPGRYLKSLRMKEAELLLKTTTLSVKEIMNQVGVTSQSQFVREFKSEFSLAPTQYRLQVMQADLLNTQKSESSEMSSGNYSDGRAAVADARILKSGEEIIRLREITLAITRAKDMESALETAAREACQAKGFVLGETWLPHPSGIHIEWRSSWSGKKGKLEEFEDAGRALAVPPGIDLCGAVWQAKNSIWVTDVSVDITFLRQAEAARTGLRSCLAVPVLSSDEVIAVLCFYYSEIRERDGHVIQFIESLAIQLASIIERKWAMSSLRQSQQKYESLINSIEGIIWEARAQDFNFTFVSKQAERLLGYPVELWLYQPTFWIDHLHPNDRDEVVSSFAIAVAEQQPQQLEYRMIASDGRVIWFQDSVRIVMEDERQMLLRGLMVDITRRKDAEEALRLSEEKFFKAFNACPDPITITRYEDGQYLYINDSFLRLTGYAREEVLGRNTLELNLWAHPEDSPRLIEVLARSGRIQEETIQFRLKSGEVRVGAFSAEIIEVGQEKLIITLTHDITAFKT